MPFVANSGTYQVKEGKLETKPIVALWPNFMEGGSATYSYVVEGDALTLSGGDEESSWTVKLARIE